MDTDPARIASFWESALGWRRTWEEEDEDQVCHEPPEGSPEDGIASDLVFLKGTAAELAHDAQGHELRAVAFADGCLFPGAGSEFADPQIFARALASTGPGYEALLNVGEAAFADAATNEAIAHIRDGLPLRAEIALVGYLARTPRAR